MTRPGWLSFVALTLAATIGLAAQSAQELYQRGLVQEHAKGDLKHAIALYTQVLQTAGKDRALAAKALRRLAGAQEKLGREAEAAETYAELVRAYPEQRTEVAIAEDRLALLRRKTRVGGVSRPVVGNDVSSVVRPLVDSYCVDCHNARNKTGGLDLDAVSRAPVEANTAVWEKITRRLQARRDPPIGAPRPEDSTYASVVSKLGHALDASYARNRTSLPVERVSDTDLATRLAAFLWSEQPDALLLEAARGGELHDSDALHRQIMRMLRDPRSASLVDSFFAQWLSLDRIKTAKPPSSASVPLNAELLDSMDRETRLFLRSQLRADRDAVELWTANYTYVNESLARHYGVPGISGKEFRRVNWPNPARGGLLGQAGVLATLSFSGRTSPTKRGLFVLTRFFGLDAPQPPANVPSLPERPVDPSGTLRERLTAHRTSPTCATCHSMFDPLGFALENFDDGGAWRTTDGGAPVDASGMFFDGTRFNGPAELRIGLLKYRDAYYHSVTRQLLAYALNRKRKAGGVYDYEMPAVRKIVRDASVDGYRWSSIIAGIAASAPFQMKTLVP
jgi:tetratricopeptide (TPR) repeat protein